MKSISKIPKWGKIMLMKHRLLKYMIVTAFFAVAISIEAKAQYEYAEKAEPPQTQNSSAERTPFTESSASPFNAPPPSYAAPPGGDAQKEIPVSDGLWIIAGLAMAYFFVRRNFQNKISNNITNN